MLMMLGWAYESKTAYELLENGDLAREVSFLDIRHDAALDELDGSHFLRRLVDGLVHDAVATCRDVKLPHLVPASSRSRSYGPRRPGFPG